MADDNRFEFQNGALAVNRKGEDVELGLKANEHGKDRPRFQRVQMSKHEFDHMVEVINFIMGWKR